jgi:diacylglycerol kinase family enzyme
VIERGRTVAIDLGRGAGKIFTSVAGAGFDAAVVNALEQRRTGAMSIAAYVGPVYQTLRSVESIPFRIELDGRAIERPASAVVVSNTRRYGWPFTLAPRAHPADGLFEVEVFSGSRLRDVLAFMLSGLMATTHLLPDVECHRARRVAISAPGRVPLQVDGDGAGTLPAAFEILPRALRVRAAPEVARWIENPPATAS